MAERFEINPVTSPYILVDMRFWDIPIPSLPHRIPQQTSMKIWVKRTSFSSLFQLREVLIGQEPTEELTETKELG